MGRGGGGRKRGWNHINTKHKVINTRTHGTTRKHNSNTVNTNQKTQDKTRYTGLRQGRVHNVLYRVGVSQYARNPNGGGFVKAVKHRARKDNVNETYFKKRSHKAALISLTQVFHGTMLSGEGLG